MADIPFRVPLNNQWSRKPRKIRVVCIGAGLAGITLSYKIGHELKLEDVIDFKIYERQVSISIYGGKYEIDKGRNSWAAPGSRTDTPA
jgi:hypothetical protein